MHRTLLILASILCFSLSLSAQSDSIIATKTFGGYKYIQDEIKLSPKMMLGIMEGNPEAYELMKQAKGNMHASGFLGFAGGFLIGWPIGTGFAGGDPLWILAAPGAVCLFLAIPLSISSKKHIGEAVDIYNSDFSSFQPKEGIQLNFGLQDHGLGLALKF